MKKIFSFLFLVFIAVSSYSMNSLTSEIVKTLDAHKSELRDMTTPETFSWLPGKIVKCRADRLEGAALLRTTINQLGYADDIIVPHKVTYDCGDADMRVIELLLPIDQEYRKKKHVTVEHCLALDQVVQIYDVCKRTKYWDIHKGNIVRLVTGQTAFVDTESSSFYLFANQDNISFVKSSILNDLQSMPINKEAQKWIKLKYEKHKKIATLNNQ